MSSASRPGALRGHRNHIGIFGRRNVGKSSLVNALTRQETAIVSEVPGTTTDPVFKPMELQPLGPVVLIDTAGLDDAGRLGDLRTRRSRAVLDRCDVALVVAGRDGWGTYEEALLGELAERRCPVIAVFNQTDVEQADPEVLRDLEPLCAAVVPTAAVLGRGLDQLREAIVRLAPPEADDAPVLVRDLVPPGGVAVLVVPIDKEAPVGRLIMPQVAAIRDLVPAGELAVLVVPIDKEAPVGRLIMPQVNAIRDLLDGDCQCLVVKESELAQALDNLKNPPALVVTDSQAFGEVEKVVPRDVPMTGFSVLMARMRGDLEAQSQAAKVIAELQPGDRVLVAESCTHHPVEDDIGRVKLPRWLNRTVGGDLEYTTVQGHDFPEDLSSFKLAVHCGACTMNRTEVLSRLRRCQNAGVPMTNYGLAIAQCFGILDRALEPFSKAEARS
jgi:small GTP-binding protein